MKSIYRCENLYAAVILMTPWGAIGGALTLVVGKRNSTTVTAERRNGNKQNEPNLKSKTDSLHVLDTYMFRSLYLFPVETTKFYSWTKVDDRVAQHSVWIDFESYASLHINQ